MEISDYDPYLRRNPQHKAYLKASKDLKLNAMKNKIFGSFKFFAAGGSLALGVHEVLSVDNSFTGIVESLTKSSNPLVGAVSAGILWAAGGLIALEGVDNYSTGTVQSIAAGNLLAEAYSPALEIGITHHIDNLSQPEITALENLNRY